MGALFVRGFWRDIKGHHALRLALTDGAASRSRTFPTGAAVKTIATGMSRTVRDLPPPATVCHDLPGTVSFEQSFSWCAAGPAAGAELRDSGDVSVGAGVRVECFAEGTLKSRGRAHRERGADPLAGLSPSATSFRPTPKRALCVTSPTAWQETSGRNQNITQPAPEDCREAWASRTIDFDMRSETGRTLLTAVGERGTPMSQGQRFFENGNRGHGFGVLDKAVPIKHSHGLTADGKTVAPHF